MPRDDPSRLLAQQPLLRTSGDLHDAIPVLARSWSGGRLAPRAEGTGKAREPPADGDRNQALASEVLSQRQTRNQYHPTTSARHEDKQPPDTRTRPPR
jgi:hypothetical protein